MLISFCSFPLSIGAITVRMAEEAEEIVKNVQKDVEDTNEPILNAWVKPRIGQKKI